MQKQTLAQQLVKILNMCTARCRGTSPQSEADMQLLLLGIALCHISNCCLSRRIDSLVNYFLVASVTSRALL